MTPLRTTGRVVVRYRFPLYLSYGFWLFGWLILFNLLVGGGVSPIPRRSPGPWFDFVFWAAIILVNGLGGPVSALTYSLSLIASNQQIIVTKYFGLFTKTYSINDAVGFDISPTRKNSTLKATVVFSGGDRISISAYANGFQEFCNLMSAAVSRT